MKPINLAEQTSAFRLHINTTRGGKIVLDIVRTYSMDDSDRRFEFNAVKLSPTPRPPLKANEGEVRFAWVDVDLEKATPQNFAKTTLDLQKGCAGMLTTVHSGDSRLMFEVKDARIEPLPKSK